jgi:protein-tyrosine-phosphatase
VLCTGNLCRSPYVTARLHQAVPQLLIRSAGTAAPVGAPPAPQIVRLLADRGVAADPGLAHRVKRRDVRAAELIITAERRHRVEAVRLDPGAADRAFTLKELARVLGPSDPVHGVAAVLGVARAAMASGEAVDHDDDLDDPYGRDDAAYERMADEADRALAVLVAALQAPRES